MLRPVMDDVAKLFTCIHKPCVTHCIDEYSRVVSPLCSSRYSAVRPFADIPAWRMLCSKCPQQFEMTYNLRYRRIEPGAQIKCFRMIKTIKHHGLSPLSSR